MSKTTDWVIDIQNKYIVDPEVGESYYMAVQDTKCMGLVPLHRVNLFPALCGTEKGAEACIADLIIELAQRVRDPEDDFNCHDICAQIDDTFVLEVKVCPKGLVWDSEGYQNDKHTPICRWAQED
jgi:hypothetical protein